MKEVIEQILEGTYDYEKGSLDFSCTKLEIEISKGEIYEGSFTIYASGGKYTLGYVTTSDPRMECLSTEIHGDWEEVSFRFHGEWMEEGEVTKGEFKVVSNKGEYYLPYVVSVVHGVPRSSIGPIRNLLQFTNLAKINWQEGVEVFYTAAFENMLKECGNHLYLLYRGLAEKEGDSQSVDEFLVAANKKKRVEFQVSEKRIFLENVTGIQEQNLNIFRNGWGYTRLEIWCDGDFLFVEKNLITDDDFLGNRFILPVYIDVECLHQGRNYGKIILKDLGNEIEIPITIVQRMTNRQQFIQKGEYKKNLCKLMQSFQRYRLEKQRKTEWLEETTGIIERLVATGERDVSARLLQAHLLITKGQVNEAGWILEHVGELMDEEISPTLEAYYIYLNTLYRKETGYTGEMSWRVERIYQEYGKDWRVAWLLLFLSEEYSKDPLVKWNFLREQFENGCRSPLIYLEALLLLNMNPTMLRELDVFEVQVLHYGRKQDAIGLELLEQILYLTERVKEYHSLLYLFLVECYRQKREERILKEICIQLIKGNRTDKEAFEWFLKGIEAGLRITNLYEYFMLSMDLDKEPDIPRQVLLYFSYQTNLDYLHNAYLFYFVTKRERSMPEVFTAYEARMEMFVREQIAKGHINRHLASLYRHFLKKSMINEGMAESLSRLLFASEIQFERKDIRSVIVCQPNHTKEQRFPVVGDRVWVPLYGKGNCLFFETNQGVRLAGDNVVHLLENYVLPKEVLEPVIMCVENNPALDIYLYESNSQGVDIDSTDLERLVRLSRYEYMPDLLRGDIVLRIVQYYHEKKDKNRMLEYLDTLDGGFMSASQRGEIIRYMVLGEWMDKAYEWYDFYGNCKVDAKILHLLLETKIERNTGEGKERLASYAYNLMTRGIYSAEIIKFLMNCYNGLIRDLRKVWNASQEYEMERALFCERFLVQLLFSGYFVGEESKVFKEYVLENGDAQLIHAYLVKNSYDSYVTDKMIQWEVLLEISRLHATGQKVEEICRLAYLKYYAEHKNEIQKEDEQVIRDFLNELLQKGIRLGCLLELRQYSSYSDILADKTIVEYRADKDAQPVIHYLIMKEDGEVGEYVAEPMYSVMDGLFVKEFILFFGESIQYYIVEEPAGTGRLTQSGTVQRGELLGEELSGRYGRITDIIISKIMQDYDTFDNLLEEYYRNDFYNRKLFQPRK